MMFTIATFIYLFIVFPILSLFLVKFYEAVCYANIRDVTTRKAIKNHLSMWESIKLIFQDSKKPLGEKLYETSRNRFNNEPFVFFFRGFTPMVVFSTAHAAKSILIDNWKDFPKNPSLLTPQQHDFIGNGLVLMNGTEWRTNRSVLNTPFQHVDKFWNIYAEKANYCVSNLIEYSKSDREIVGESSVGKHQVKIKDILTRMTLDVIGEAALDCDFNFLDPSLKFSSNNSQLTDEEGSQNERVLEAFRFIFRNLNSWERMLGGKLYSSLPIVDNQRLNKSIRIMNNFISSIIEKKRIEHIDRRVIDTIQPNMESPMDLMIEANQAFHDKDEEEKKPAKATIGQPVSEEFEQEEIPAMKITDKNLRDNTLLLFLAGHATTADSISFLLLNLAKNERVQEKLYSELQQAFPERFKHVDGKYCEFIIQSLEDLATLNKLPYLECVMNENLRFYPPVGLLNRISKKSHIIDGVKVSKDQAITLSIKSIHFNKDLWGENVDEFYPERFSNYSQQVIQQSVGISVLEEDKSHLTHPVCSFLPFGLGARSCLGSKFSMMEQKVFIVHFLSKFSVKLPEEYLENKERVGLGELSHLMNGAGPLMSLKEDFKLELWERGIVSNIQVEQEILQEETQQLESTNPYVRPENKEFPQYNVNREELVRSLP